MQEVSGLNTGLLLDKNELKMALRNRKVSPGLSRNRSSGLLSRQVPDANLNPFSYPTLVDK